MTQIQASPFGPLHFYDAPEVALTQIMDDEATFGSFVNTFFSPEYLSPPERDSYADRMKKDLGYKDKGVGSALVDVFTNPLSYLAFLFVPGAARASGRVFSEAAKNNLFGGMFRNGYEMMIGTPGHAAVTQIQTGVQRLAAESENIIGRLEMNYSKAKGITRDEFLVPARIKDDALRAEVEMDKRLIVYRNSGLGDRQTITRSELFPRIERVLAPRMEGPPERITDPTVIKSIFKAYKKSGVKRSTELFEHQGSLYRIDPRLADRKTGEQIAQALDVTTNVNPLFNFAGGIDEALSRRGVLGLADGYQDMFRQRAIRNFMVDGTTIQDVKRVERITDKAARKEASKKIIDFDKVLRLKSAADSQRYTDEMFGMPGFMDRLLSRETRAALLSKGKSGLTDEKFKDMVLDGMSNELFASGAYHPRNSFDYFHFRRKPGGEREFVRAEGLDRPTYDPKTGTINQRNSKSGLFQASGRSIRRTSRDSVYHMDDLELMRLDAEALGGKVTGRFASEMRRSDRVMRIAGSRGEGRVVPMRQIDLTKSVGAYENQTARDYVMYVDRLTEVELQAQRDSLFDAAGKLRYTERDSDVLKRAYGKDAKEPPRLLQVFNTTGKDAPPGGWNRSHLMEQTGRMLLTVAEDTAGVSSKVSRMRGEKAQELLRETIIPAALGVRTDSQSLMRGLVTQGQAYAEKFANSSFANSLGAAHPMLGNAVKQLKYYAERPAMELVDPILSKSAGYLYSSHLGLNMASVLLNLQQPFLHLNALVGAKATIKGMGDAAADLQRYAVERSKMPLNISNVEREELLKRTLTYPEETGLMADVISDLDKLMATERVRSGKSFNMQKIIDLSLKGFEKAEWMNRLTTVHAIKHNYISRGLAEAGEGGVKFASELAEQQFRADAKLGVQQFQFGADILGTPMVFMPGAMGGAAGEVLSNPLIRQFQSFGLRSLTSLGFGGASIAGGKRFITGTNVQVPYVVGDTLRMIGTSAIIYEGAKGLIGADLSRGGAVETFSSFADPEKIASGEFPFIVPPVLSISTDAMRGLLGGDLDVLGNALARTVPGGVGIQRALQVAPDASQNFLTSLAAPSQKFYAEYGNMNPDGLVPIRKSDGTLVDYQSPTSLILRGLGVSMSMPQFGRDIDGYMVRQRDRINKARREWIEAAIVQGDIGKAEQINAKFQKAYGFRLPVTKQQITAAVKGMETPRSLRMMDRMPPEIRAYFQQEMSRDPERVASTSEALMNIPTSADRRGVTGTDTPVELSPEVLQKLKQAMAETEAQRDRLGFEAFTGF